jgi:hypothetical protein
LDPHLHPLPDRERGTRIRDFSVRRVWRTTRQGEEPNPFPKCKWDWEWRNVLLRLDIKTGVLYLC